MKRRAFLKVAGTGLAASAVAAPAIAQSMPEIKWRLTASWPKSLDTLYGSRETFSKYVAEATDNKFQVQIFAAGEIVPGLQVLDAVQNGTVEICHTATYYFIGKDPTWALFCAVPFGLNTRQQNAWYYDGDGLKLMNEFGKKFNVYSLRRRQYRRADGRLVPQGDQDRRGSQGPQVPHRRLGRQDIAEARRRAAADCRAATSIRHWRKARSTRPSGSAPMTTRSSASTRSRSTTIILAGGKAAPPTIS